MANKKSGLGRGLNALFDEAPAPAAVNTDSSKEEARKSTPESPKEAPAKKQPAPASSEKKETKAEKPASKPAEELYISEDALEHAKVVTREARPAPVKRTRPEQKRSTSTVYQEKKAAAAKTAPAKADAPAAAKAAAPVKEEKGATGMVPLDKVQPNPDQPRTNFKPEEIEELAGSIKKEGLLQPILVHKVGDHYQIIAGERRWQACKSLGMKEIPVRFWQADNDKALELALIENIQRSDLNPIEEAYGYKRLMERRGMTQSEVAQTVSKGRSTIANALRLLDLPEEAQQLLFEEKISAGHARAILSVPTAEGRKTLTTKLLNEKLSVRETEAIARLLSGKAKADETGASKRVPAPASFKKAARGLTRLLSVPVRVKTVQGKNKIEIQFKDEEELERILKVISSED